jgi:hypothetical protein
VGGKEFGPVQADPKGAAMVPVVVPPGVTEGNLVSVLSGETTEETLNLRVPETRTLQLFPLPAGAPAGQVVRVRAVKLQPMGGADADAELVFKPASGTVGEPEHEGDGIYGVDWTLPLASEATNLKMEVSIDGETIQRDTASMKVLPVGGAVSLSVAGEDGNTVGTASATGVGELDWAVAGGDAPDATDEGQTLEVEGEEGLLTALLRLPASPNPPRYVVVLPAEGRVANDGSALVPIDLVSVDGWGLPVAGVKLSLSSDGDGSMPDSVTTDDNGLARVSYEAGSAPALVRVRAEGGGAQGVASLLQGPGTGPALPWTSEGVRAEVEALWATRVVSGRSGAVTAAAAPPPEPVAEAPLGPAGAEITAFVMSFEPEEVHAGAPILVIAEARSAEDERVPKAKIDLLTSSGELGDVKEFEPGRYRAELIADKGFVGEVKVTAVADSGTMSLLRVDIQKAPKVAAAEPEAKEPKEPAEAGDYPWLRVRVSGVGSRYRYEQSPSEEPGSLLPSTLSVSGADSASPWGFEADGRAYLPMLPYLGLRGSFRATAYSIAAGAFEGEAKDWLYDASFDVLGRYPFNVGSDMFWVGGRAGFRYNDFMVFTGCLTEGCTVSYEPLALPGIGVGAEGGAEIGIVYIVTGYTHGFANATVPYLSQVDFNAGVQVHDNVFIDAGFTSVSRKVVLRGQDSGIDRGELADGQFMGKLGVGFSL